MLTQLVPPKASWQTVAKVVILRPLPVSLETGADFSARFWRVNVCKRYGGVLGIGGTPKWFVNVCSMENPIKMMVYEGKSIYKWMITSGTPILGNLHMVENRKQTILKEVTQGFIFDVHVVLSVYVLENMIGCRVIYGDM